jgi:hypothetical protein
MYTSKCTKASLTPQPPTQDRQLHHFGEALAKALARVLFAVEVEDFPLQPAKLIE